MYINIPETLHKAPRRAYLFHAHLRRGGGLFNLETTMVSVLHKKLEYKVKKLKHETLEVTQPRIKNKLEFPVGESRISRDWLIQPNINKWTMIRWGEERGEGLKRDGIINFLSLKKKGGLLERGGTFER